jgi:hypothetical protein
MKGVPDCPLLCSKRLELKFSHVEMDSLTRKAITVPINSRPLQVEGIGESGGLSCKDYTDTSNYSFLCRPIHHYR